MEALMIALIPWIIGGATALGIGALLGASLSGNRSWRDLGIKSPGGKSPTVILRRTREGKTTYISYIPDGIDMKKMLEGGKYNHMIKQTFGDLKYTEIEALDGHRLAVTVFEDKLPDMCRFELSLMAGSKDSLHIPVGESLRGRVFLDIGDAVPHVGLAGITGGGKSTTLRSIITWLVLHPVKTDLYLIDLKEGIELKMFRRCDNVVSFDRTVAEGLATIRALTAEMERRLKLFYSSCKGITGIDEYNLMHRGQELRRAVLIIDEFADFEDTPEAIALMTELGRKSRAAGIHMVLATQRPSAEVMQGNLKANIPAWMCFKVKNSINSNIVLGHGGAEKLPGKGRMIFDRPPDGEVETQGYYLSPGECEQLIAPTLVQKPERRMDTSGVLE